MKNVFILIGCLCVMLIQLACNISYKNRDRTLTGQMVDSTDGKPIANAAFVLYTYRSAGFNYGDCAEKFPFTTNNDGEFEIVYNYNVCGKKAQDYIEIQHAGYGPAFLTPGGNVWSCPVRGQKEIDAGVIRTHRKK